MRSVRTTRALPDLELGLASLTFGDNDMCYIINRFETFQQKWDISSWVRPFVLDVHIILIGSRDRPFSVFLQCISYEQRERSLKRGSYPLDGEAMVHEASNAMDALL